LKVEVLETVGKGRNAFAKNNIPGSEFETFKIFSNIHLYPDLKDVKTFL